MQLEPCILSTLQHLIQGVAHITGRSSHGILSTVEPPIKQRDNLQTKATHLDYSNSPRGQPLNKVTKWLVPKYPLLGDSTAYCKISNRVWHTPLYYTVGLQLYHVTCLPVLLVNALSSS